MTPVHKSKLCRRKRKRISNAQRATPTSSAAPRIVRLFASRGRRRPVSPSPRGACATRPTRAGAGEVAPGDVLSFSGTRNSSSTHRFFLFFGALPSPTIIRSSGNLFERLLPTTGAERGEGGPAPAPNDGSGGFERRGERRRLPFVVFWRETSGKNTQPVIVRSFDFWVWGGEGRGHEMSRSLRRLRWFGFGTCRIRLPQSLAARARGGGVGWGGSGALPPTATDAGRAPPPVVPNSTLSSLSSFFVVVIFFMFVSNGPGRRYGGGRTVSPGTVPGVRRGERRSVPRLGRTRRFVGFEP